MIRCFKKGKYEDYTKLFLSIHSHPAIEAYHKLFRAVRKYLPHFSHLNLAINIVSDEVEGIDAGLAELLKSYFPEIDSLEISNICDDLPLTCKSIGGLSCLKSFKLRQSHEWISPDTIIALADSFAGLPQLRRINWYELYGGWCDDWVRRHKRDDKAYEQLFSAVGGRKNLEAKFELNSEAKLEDPKLMQILKMGPNDQQVLALMASKNKLQSFDADTYLGDDKNIWVEALCFARDLKDFACFHQLFQKMPIEHWLPSENKKRPREDAMASQPLKKARGYPGAPGRTLHSSTGPNRSEEPAQAPPTSVASPVSGMVSATSQKAVPAPAPSTIVSVPTGSPCPAPNPPSYQYYYPYSYPYPHPYFYPYPYYYHYPYAYPPAPGSPGLVPGAHTHTLRAAMSAPAHYPYYHCPASAPGQGGAVMSPAPGYQSRHPHVAPAPGANIPA